VRVPSDGLRSPHDGQVRSFHRRSLIGDEAATATTQTVRSMQSSYLVVPGSSQGARTPAHRASELPSLMREQQLRSSNAEPQSIDGPPVSDPRTPGRFQIYNDSLPASIQPRTPNNLPEARHQSRIQGAYTVPTRQSSVHSTTTPTAGQIRRSRRNMSPVGLREPGFTGLYGGIENTDDSGLFERGT